MTAPRTAATRAALAELLRPRTGRVALVPTMGALHRGHASLMRHAREVVGEQGRVVVSIFVNPTQFGAGEDLDRYPRTLAADLEVCAEQGVDVVFTPSVGEMYPAGVFDPADPATVTVSPGPLGSVLEGASRPSHFRGVLTVVAKLFGLVRPDVAVFGEKDYQQLTLIAAMATELCCGVEVIAAPTVRDDDGLALSSRNRFLTDADRTAALALPRALQRGREAAAAGDGVEAVLAAAHDVLAAEPCVETDYLVLTGPGLGDPPAAGPARMLVAARVGPTRLIDNVAIDLGRGI